MYYGHLGTNHQCPDYQGVLIFQVSLYDEAGTISKCVDYAGVLIISSLYMHTVGSVNSIETCTQLQ